MSDLYCPIRKSRCKPLPEEVVRIGLIQRMIDALGFPESTLVIEKELRSLPHRPCEPGTPDRRVDILCFAKGIHPSIELYPLLMIECKAVKITNKVIGQVAGYNHYVQAPFICVANQHEIRTGWLNSQSVYDFVPYLPTYTQLIASLP